MKDMLAMAKEVQKESLSQLNFPTDDVLSHANDRSERSRVLHKATSLGNIEKHKVMILFSDEEGYKKVHTTIWASTEQKVILKGGVYIPVNRIHYVETTP